MKSLMKIFSLLLVVILIALIIPIISPEMDTDIIDTIAIIVASNYLPLISICFCCFCLERNDNNYFVRIIPVYMMVSILLSVLIVTVFKTDYVLYTFGGDPSSVARVLIDINNFVTSTHLWVTLLSILMIVNPNNRITTIIKKVAYGLIIANIALVSWIQVKSFLEEKLPNVYDYDGYDGKGFNLPSMESTEYLATKLYSVTVIGEAFAIMLLLTTNYAFSATIEYDVDDIDVYEAKKEAENLAKNQMNKLYSKQKEEAPQVIDRSSSEKGLMNVDNQLGTDSNVGKVKESSKTANVENTSIETVIPHSSGPVINETVNKEPLANIENPVKQFENNIQEQTTENQATTTEEPK